MHISNPTHIVEMIMLLINVFHGNQILNTSTDVGYDIHATCTFFADETVSIHDLKRDIHVSLKLLLPYFSSQLKLNGRECGMRLVDNYRSIVEPSFPSCSIRPISF
jgi:hypothetical protein